MFFLRNKLTRFITLSIVKLLYIFYSYLYIIIDSFASRRYYKYSFNKYLMNNKLKNVRESGNDTLFISPDFTY